MSEKAFENWWRLLKPAECDEVEEHFRECWQAATAAERERCVKACENQYEPPSWKDAPNATGLWIAAYPNPTAVRIDDVQALDRVKAWPGRWFGPIKEDRK